MVWPKGNPPLTVIGMRNKLSTLWKSMGRWGVISFGKWYYEFSFSCIEEVRRVRVVSLWNLSPSYLKPFIGTKDFNPTDLKQISDQVWVRIHGLSQKYWRLKILLVIASSIGDPLMH